MENRKGIVFLRLGTRMVKLSNYSSLIQAGDQLISAIAGLIGIPVIDKGKSLYQLLSAPKTVGESMLFDNFT